MVRPSAAAGGLTSNGGLRMTRGSRLFFCRVTDAAEHVFADAVVKVFDNAPVGAAGGAFERGAGYVVEARAFAMRLDHITEQRARELVSTLRPNS